MDKKYKSHIRKNDTVKVIAGNAKNKTGKVITVYPKLQKAIVEGLNLYTHHIKPTQKEPKGSIQKKEAPIHISNLALIDPKTKETTSITRKENKEGKLQRYAKKTGNPL